MEITNIPKGKLYNTKEAADRLGYSIENIYRLVFAGKLTPQKFYGKNIFTNAELTRFEQARNAKKSKSVSE